MPLPSDAGLSVAERMPPSLLRTARILELLSEEAPIELFEQPLTEEWREEMSSDELAVVERAATQALRIRQDQQERQRRARDFAVLYETACDLSSLRDLDDVLQAIVSRARTLLRADVGYLTLHDDATNETRMRVTAGTVTDEFREMRLKPGQGLGGLVEEKLSPYWTSDYLKDDRFVHSPEVDKLVRDEGLTGILGVPLRRRREVIGVLFAGSRGRWSVAPEEVALLTSLAAHAAIAIENARLFERNREAVGRLSRSNAELEETREAMQRAGAVHDTMTRLYLSGADVSEVLDSLRASLGGSIQLLDRSGRLVGASGDPVDELDELIRAAGALPHTGRGPQLVSEALTTCLSEHRTVLVPNDRGQLTRWVTPVAAGSEELGGIVATNESALDAGDLRSLESASLVLGLVLLRVRMVADTENQVKGELVVDLCRAKHDELGALAERFERAGVRSGNAHVIAVVQCRAGTGKADLRRLRDVLRADGMAGVVEDQVVVLVPGEDPQRVAQRLLMRSRRAADEALVVVDGPASDVVDLRAAYDAARRTARVLTSVGRTSGAVAAESFGLLGVLLDNANEDELRMALKRLLRPVRQMRNHEEYMRTAEVFLASGCRPGRAAERLQVHINTLYHRLARIDEVIGDEWREGDAALQLQLALRVARLVSDDVP